MNGLNKTRPKLHGMLKQAEESLRRHPVMWWPYRRVDRSVSAPLRPRNLRRVRLPLKRKARRRLVPRHEMNVTTIRSPGIGGVRKVFWNRSKRTRLLKV
jgi:hypothetical protein